MEYHVVLTTFRDRKENLVHLASQVLEELPDQKETKDFMEILVHMALLEQLDHQGDLKIALHHFGLVKATKVLKGNLETVVHQVEQDLLDPKDFEEDHNCASKDHLVFLDCLGVMAAKVILAKEDKLVNQDQACLHHRFPDYNFTFTLFRVRCLDVVVDLDMEGT